MWQVLGRKALNGDGRASSTHVPHMLPSAFRLGRCLVSLALLRWQPYRHRPSSNFVDCCGTRDLVRLSQTGWQGTNIKHAILLPCDDRSPSRILVRPPPNPHHKKNKRSLACAHARVTIGVCATCRGGPRGGMKEERQTQGCHAALGPSHAGRSLRKALTRFSAPPPARSRLVQTATVPAMAAHSAGAPTRH